jgi:hypothetical protein
MRTKRRAAVGLALRDANNPYKLSVSLADFAITGKSVYCEVGQDMKVGRG